MTSFAATRNWAEPSMRPERLTKSQAVRVGDALAVEGGAEKRFAAIASALADAGFDDISSPGVSGELARSYADWILTRRGPEDEGLAEEMEELGAWMIEMRGLP